MSSALTGNKIKDSYQALLKIGTNGSLDPTTLITISDGLGNDTPLQLSGDKIVTTGAGLQMDFANSIFQFGDYTGSVNPTYLYIDVNNSIAKVQTFNRELKVMLNQNIALGEFDGNYTIDNLSGAVLNNTIIGNFNWTLTNSSLGNYPLANNCFINDTSGVDTQSISLLDSIFINNGSLFDVGLNVIYSNKQEISNCFVFGATNIFGDNLFKFYTPDLTVLKANVIIFNTSNTDIGTESNNLFILNASGVFIENQCSCINIFGGDFYDNNGTLVQAEHSLPIAKTTSVNIYGQKALAKNNFSNVFGYYNMSYGTTPGQVQIEQKQLFRYYSDPDANQLLYDTLGSATIIVPQGSNCLVEVKIVSYIGENDFGTGGNWFIYDTFMVSNDNLTNVMRISAVKNVTNDNTAQVNVVYSTTTNGFLIEVHPHVGGSAPCWVKAEVVLNKISVV
jgi:hypothetical protein